MGSTYKEGAFSKMIKFVSGDMFSHEADIRINTVNCVGVMGAGVALMFKNRYPEMFKDYVKACERNEVKPGQPHVWEEASLLSKCTIINLPTKVHWKNPSKYEYIEKGLIWLREFLRNRENAKVTLPALGCGHGGLDWNIVKEMIIKYLGDLNVEILAFEPGSSIKYQYTVNEEELEKQDVYRLLPNHEFYPTSLAGRSALEIFYKGNVELLKNKSIAVIANPKSTEREKNALSLIIDELPSDDFVLILGLNNRYDTELAEEILSKGFKVIFSIPYGILEFKIRKKLERYWDYQNIVVLSTTHPSQTWKKHESINSLRFRMRIADFILINNLEYENLIQYENDIRKADGKVFYVNYWNIEPDFFNRLKGIKIGLNPSTDKPNILSLLNTIS